MFGEGVVQQGFPDVILRPGEEYRNQVGGMPVAGCIRACLCGR